MSGALILWSLVYALEKALSLGSKNTFIRENEKKGIIVGIFVSTESVTDRVSWIRFYVAVK